MTAQAPESARQAVLLDADLIRSRRIELRMTERQLGRLVGKSGQLVRRIETGLSHEGITLRTAHRLAGALGLALTELCLSGPRATAQPMNEPEEAPDQDGGAVPPVDDERDVARLGALLVELGERASMELIAQTLAMSAHRLEAVLTGLTPRLHPLGLALEITGAGVAIVAERGLLASMDADRARRANRASRPLGAQEAKMLLRVLRGEVRTTATLDRPAGMIMAKLLKAGAIELPPGKWAGASPPHLTPEVQYGLMLEASRGPDAPTDMASAVHPTMGTA